MAINSIEACDKIISSLSSSNFKGTDSNTRRLVKIDFGFDEAITTANKCGKSKKKMEFESPYVSSDKVQLFSRITEKRIDHKKSDFKSSFPLATNLYKANSDEFKALKQFNRKIKKSVLTLPNKPVPMPQSCTVSDVNDTEYNKRNNEENKPNKRRTPTKKIRVRTKDFEFYDRDAWHCSQLNINLDSSSTDLIKYGDGKKISKKKHAGKKSLAKGDIKPHDVWTMLRNMNRFQFKSSPPVSIDSITTPKKKKSCNKKRNHRLIETCRTEEVAYIANFQVGCKSQAVSITSSTSLDRVTVINNIDLCIKHDELKPQNIFNNKNYQRAPSPLYHNIQMKDNPRNKYTSLEVKDSKRKPPKVTNERSKVYKKGKQDFTMQKQESCRSKISISSEIRDSNETSNYVRPSGNNDDGTFNVTNISSTRENKKEYADFGEHLNLSGHIGGGKIAFHNFVKAEKEKIPRIYLNKYDHQINRFDKTGQNDEPEGIMSKKKPRLVTTMPSGSIMPKLTTADIKRRLSHIKFPLVILGKDQISSNVEVMDYGYPQFDGLNKQIWPFMVEWTNDSGPRTLNTLKSKVINEAPLGKPNDKKSVNHIATFRKKVEYKRGIQNLDTNNVQQPKKSKPMRQFKEKMLKLLYKKSNQDTITNTLEAEKEKVEKRNVTVQASGIDVCTETDDKIILRTKLLSKKPPTFYRNSKEYSVAIHSSRLIEPYHPWSKAKCASDFIDKVIKNIKNGTYYTHDCYFNQNIKTDYREANLQVTSDNNDEQLNNYYDQCLELIPNVKITSKYDPLKAIPGFDDHLPTLEIKTLNINQIAVKHCLTNVTVQFDVSVPKESEARVNVTDSLTYVTSDSYIAFKESDVNDTKVFKCKTTILNAMLPAELCYAIPRIMRNILDSNVSGSVRPVNVDQPNSILEVTPSKALDHDESILLPLYISPELRSIQVGKFYKRKFVKRSINIFLAKIIEKIRYNWSCIREILPDFSTKSIFHCDAKPIYFLSTFRSERMIMPLVSFVPKPNNQCISSSHISNCTVLQPYNEFNERLLPAFEKIDMLKVMENLIMCRKLFDLNIPIHTLKFTCDANDITINVIGENQGLKKTLSVTINKLKIDSLFSGFKRTSCEKATASKIVELEPLPIKSIECSSDGRKTLKKTYLRNVASNSKTKRKGFVRLYKKCKSTSNIPGERSCTPISKITNLDVFFQVLGSGKLLSSVFNGSAEQRILSSIMEMKSWITDITPRQALLVLLLTNKKNTVNLVRYRPVLLQGIAVNRITRASELDMEIEVIERENLNKLSEFEGISYLPPSVENHDNLLEELYWIAKTTASDYQRPFDDSSEQLLKSLLEKRKKLNPSYLRVMARYVGLGLLKPSNKK